MIRIFFLIFFSIFSVKAEQQSMDLSNLEPRNNYFVGREKELKNLDTLLEKSSFVIISGLSGFGKTEIAKEYAHEHSGDYKLIWWFHGKSNAETQIDLLLQELSKKNNIKHFKSLDLTILIEQLRKFILLSKCPCLFIFDNYDGLSPEMGGILDLAKKHGNLIHVIVTSHNWNGNKMISIEPFKRTESLQFLSKFLKEDALEKKEKLAELLGDYPLALFQAISFITTNPSINIDDYIDVFNENRKELWEAERKIIEQDSGKIVPKNNYQKTVATALSITLNSLKNKMPLALEMIQFVSLLSSKDILEDILRTWALKVRKATKLQFHEALSQLSNYSLLTKQTNPKDKKEESFYSQYELIQKFIREELTAKQKLLHLENASQSVLKSLTDLGGTVDEQFVGREYYGNHLENICKNGHEFWKSSTSLTESKIAFLYYIHVIKRNFEKSQLLIDELLPQEAFLKVNSLSYLWLYMVLENNDIFNNLNRVRDYRNKALDSLSHIKDSYAKNSYEIIINTDFVFSLLNFGYVDEAYELKERMKHSLNQLGSEKIIGMCLLDLSNASACKEKYEEALEELNKGENILKKFDEFSLYLPIAKVAKAECLLMLQKYEEALELIEQAKKALNETYASQENHFSTKADLIKAEALLHTGHPEEAKRVVKPLIEYYEGSKSFDKDSLKGKMHLILGEIYEKQENLMEALSEYKKAEEQYNTIVEVKNIPALSKLYQQLAILGMKLNDEILSEKYLKMHIENFGIAHPRTFEIKKQLEDYGFL